MGFTARLAWRSCSSYFEMFDGKRTYVPENGKYTIYDLIPLKKKAFQQVLSLQWRDLCDRWKVLVRTDAVCARPLNVRFFGSFVLCFWFFSRSVQGLNILLMTRLVYGFQHHSWEFGHRTEIFHFYKGLWLFHVTEFSCFARHSNFPPFLARLDRIYLNLKLSTLVCCRNSCSFKTVYNFYFIAI